jgi:tetratricopeptide (TPR) repeat protein
MNNRPESAPHHDLSGRCSLDKVLILTRDDVNARRDRDALKAFRVAKVQHFAAGSEALDFLGREGVSLILCDTVLADMDGVRFTTLLRQNMNLKSVPVIMVTADNRKNTVLTAIAAGCSGYILRPYSLETFERHVALARTVDSYNEIEQIQLEEARNMVTMGDFDDAIEAFEEIIQIQDEAQKYYDLGCHYLVKSKYGKAIIAFKKAVKINDLFAEAYKGLADAYRAKGDIESSMAFLHKAAEVHAQFDRLEETKALFLEILRYEAQAPNPFNTLGVRLRKQGDLLGALHAYDQAVKVTPEDEHIYFNMAKAYYFRGEKEKAAENLATALKLDPGFTEARGLYARITGEEWGGVQEVGVARAAGSESLIDD